MSVTYFFFVFSLSTVFTVRTAGKRKKDERRARKIDGATKTRAGSWKEKVTEYDLLEINA